MSPTDPARIIVFLGPSLAAEEARRILPARYLPPARCGDVLRARRLEPRVIAIVDGLFGRTPAVWHKEILLALEHGIGVFGAASMGALRAAELAAFGMIGVGAIFEAYRDGRYTDDDEVAVAHGPASEGYRPRSDALVNIRATLASAVELGVIGAPAARELLDLLKQTFYPERRLADAVERWSRGSPAEAQTFRRFLEQGGYVDQKRLDALALLRRLAGDLGTGTSFPGPTNRSSFILKLHHQVMCRPFSTSELDLPVEERVALEARLLGPMYQALRRLARLMSVAEALGRARHVTVTAAHRARVFEDDDFGLGRTARSARWRRAHDLDMAAMERFVLRLAGIRALLDARPSTRLGRPVRAAGDLPYQLALMRVDDRYARHRPDGVRAGARADRAVVRRAARGAGHEVRLYRRSARLWRVIDEALTARGIEPPDDVQALGDEFRRARGLLDARAARSWMRANGLGLDGFADLVALDARLTLISEGARTYTLGLPDDVAPVGWLVDAIRLGGFYPDLRRRVASVARSPGRRRRPRAPDLARELREHWARLDALAPADLEAQARSLDFTDGGAELAAALHDRATARRDSRSRPRRVEGRSTANSED